MSVLLLVASLIATAVARSNNATGPFLEQVDNQTWVIGNEVWNMTQQVTYGVQLYYKDRDCVGDAVGHYVSYSKSPKSIRSSPQKLNQVFQPRWRRLRPKLDISIHRFLRHPPRHPLD